MSTTTESPSTSSANSPWKNVSEFSESRYERLVAIERKGLAEAELSVCADSPAHWLTWWAWTYDPRQRPAVIPFAPWPKQAAFLDWLGERERAEEDGLVEKSRDAGVSWLCCAFAAHRWLFREGCSIGFGSRKEEYVDKAGDPDSLFEKIRILLDNLPRWMLPAGFTLAQHATFRKIVNPANGSTITGEAGDNIGRGGRKSLYFVDEAAFIERAHLVERSLSQTTRCRIDVSTPNGIGNPFYTKRFAGTVPVFTFSWRDDPRKDEAWYTAQKAKFDPVTVAQEIDIDYTASVEGTCIPAEWVRAAVGLVLPETTAPKLGGLDIGEEGPDLSVLTARRGPHVTDIASWGRSTTTQTAYRALEECQRLAIPRMNYDADGPGMGTKGTWRAMENCPVETVPVHTGHPPTETKWPDGRTSVEKFANLRAELWWLLRTRFERTFEYATQGKQHPPDELISLPAHPQLIAELSMPKVEYTDKGKIQLESKKSMRSRGVKSPDFADSLALAFAPEKPRKRIMAW
jgi:phage terminase large subunit